MYVNHDELKPYNSKTPGYLVLVVVDSVLPYFDTLAELACVLYIKLVQLYVVCFVLYRLPDFSVSSQ